MSTIPVKYKDVIKDTEKKFFEKVKTFVESCQKVKSRKKKKGGTVSMQVPTLYTEHP